MSRILPQSTVDALRKYTDVAVDVYGIDCSLWLPTNAATVEAYDDYAKPADYTNATYTTRVFIDWSPNKFKLRALGVFNENELPIIGYFSHTIKDVAGNPVPIDILIGSYIKIDTQYVPDTIDTEYFDVVDVVVPGMHEKLVTKAFKLAPRRIKPA